MDYKVIKRFGKYNVGDIVSDKDYYIRRKLQEGGCLVEYNKSDKTDKKSMPNDYQKKVMPGNYKNKGGKK